MGLFDSIAGLFGGGSNSASRKGLKYTDDSVNTMLQRFREAQSKYQTDLASGRYNPDAALQQTEKTLGHNFDIGTGNISARLGGMGYKRGDSRNSQELRHFSENAQNQRSQMILALKDAFAQSQDRGLANVDNAARGYSSAAGGAGGTYLQEGARQSASGGLGALFSSLAPLMGGGTPGGGGKRKTGGGGGGNDYTQWDNNANHQYDEYGNLV